MLARNISGKLSKKNWGLKICLGLSTALRKCYFSTYVHLTFEYSQVNDNESWDWGDWEPCSVTCGGGTAQRKSTCKPGHLACSFDKEEIECNTQPCNYMQI